MCDQVSQSYWRINSNVAPSAHLDIEMSAVQQTLLNPTGRDALLGSIIYDVKGEGAHQKIAKRWLDMISGNISSYSRWTNDPKRLKQIIDVTELTSRVAAVSADADINKAKRTEDEEKKVEEKETKKKRDEEEHTRKNQELLPALTALMLPYTDGSGQDLKSCRKNSLLTLSNTTSGSTQKGYRA